MALVGIHTALDFASAIAITTISIKKVDTILLVSFKLSKEARLTMILVSIYVQRRGQHTATLTKLAAGTQRPTATKSSRRIWSQMELFQQFTPMEALPEGPA